MEIFHRYNSEILRLLSVEERIRRKRAKLSCPASLTAMSFSFSSESSSHLVLPHRYSMTVRANVTRPVVGSISLSHGDWRPPTMGFPARVVMSRIRNCLPARRACVLLEESRARRWPRNLSLRGPSHRKDGTWRSFDGAETRDGAPTSSLFVVVVVVVVTPAAPPALLPSRSLPRSIRRRRGKRDRSGRLRRRRDVADASAEGLLILRMRGPGFLPIYRVS